MPIHLLKAEESIFCTVSGMVKLSSPQFENTLAGSVVIGARIVTFFRLVQLENALLPISLIHAGMTTS